MTPFTYLGVPLFQGKPKTAHLQPILDRIKRKLSAWKGSPVSIMGRMQLVKSIIPGMLMYNFHIYPWPISLLKIIDICTKKIVTVAWHKVCSPEIEGGLGIRSLRLINEAAQLKLSWELLSTNKDWAVLLRARHLRHKMSILHYVKLSIWSAIKKILPTLKEHSCWLLGNGKQINLWHDKCPTRPEPIQMLLIGLCRSGLCKFYFIIQINQI